MIPFICLTNRTNTIRYLLNQQQQTCDKNKSTDCTDTFLKSVNVYMHQCYHIEHHVDILGGTYYLYKHVRPIESASETKHLFYLSSGLNRQITQKPYTIELLLGLILRLPQCAIDRLLICSKIGEKAKVKWLCFLLFIPI